MNMNEYNLTNEIIDKIKADSVAMVCTLMGDDLKKVILYGSCARGDFTDDSDIDIALITDSDRMTAKKYNDGLASIATDLAMKYLSVVNFVVLPSNEYNEKKSWYLFFRNIDQEGSVLYG